MAEVSRSSSAPSRSVWVRLTLPSIADLLFVGLFATLVFTPLAIRLLGDAGIGWHIRTGQVILATHQIPRTDPFSSSMAGKPWYAWEWLYDLIVGECEASLGLNGVVLFNAFVIAAVSAWVLGWLMRRGVNVAVSLILILLALSASMIHFLARPHVLSWLFTVAWFVILDGVERDSANATGSGSLKLLFLLPVSMLVWVNVHGGFLIGFVLLGIFLLAAVWDWLRLRSERFEEAIQKIAARKRAGVLVGIGLLSVLASFANPYGWKLHEHIFSYLSSRFLMNHIQEFQSPDFHGIAQRCFLLLLLITVVALSLWGRRLRASGILVVIFAVYSGLYASRSIPVSSLLLVMVAGPLIPSPDRGFLGRMAAFQAQLRGHIWPLAAILCAFLIARKGGRVGSEAWIDAHFDPHRMPVAAADYLASHGTTQPVLTPDSWGGYLIYRRYPQGRVVVDDRHDFYGEDFFKSYLKMVHVEQGWQDFLRDHEVSCVLFPRDAALTNVLLEEKDWTPVYRDDVAVLLARRSPQGRSVEGCN